MHMSALFLVCNFQPKWTKKQKILPKILVCVAADTASLKHARHHGCCEKSIGIVDGLLVELGGRSVPVWVVGMHGMGHTRVGYSNQPMPNVRLGVENASMMNVC